MNENQGVMGSNYGTGSFQIKDNKIIIYLKTGENKGTTTILEIKEWTEERLVIKDNNQFVPYYKVKGL